MLPETGLNGHGGMERGGGLPRPLAPGSGKGRLRIDSALCIRYQWIRSPLGRFPLSEESPWNPGMVERSQTGSPGQSRHPAGKFPADDKKIYF
jgi:hypothetical protein